MANKTTFFTPSPVYNDLVDAHRDALRVQESINSMSLYMATESSHKAPDKPVSLQVVYADGVNWNPGKGEGLYIYVGGQWKKFNIE